MILVIVKM